MSSMLDARLCLVTERSFRPGGDFLEVLDAVLSAGVTLLQFRDKTGLGDRELFALGLQVRDLARRHRVPLIVNDRLDLAMALDAEGVHLGQSDLPLAVARKLWDPSRIYGISVTNPDQALEAARGGATYLGAGALLATATKPDAIIMEAGGLEAVCAATKLPVIAIGGVNAQNTGDFVRRGCAGVAVVSAVWKAVDPRGATMALKKAVDGARN